MATKSVILSDISGTELPDDQRARVIIEHPDTNWPIEIDVSAEEAEKFQSSTLRMANITIFAPGKGPRNVQVETKVLDKLFPRTDFEAVMSSGRRVTKSAQQSGPRKAVSSGARGDRVDYTQPNTFGQLHRGRVTDAEKDLVQKNKEQASKNRETQSGSPIDWDDPKERARYGLD